MKKMLFRLSIVFVVLLFAACNATGGSSSTSGNGPNVQGQDNEEQMPPETTASEAQALPNENMDGTAGSGSTEFTVEISPELDSVKPLDDPYLSFLLEVPDEWILEEMDYPYQYVYYHEEGGIPAAIVQGDRVASDPENPFANVERSPDTLSFDEIDILSYPVLRHVIEFGYTEPEYYAYSYYVDVGGRLIYFDFSALDNTPEIQERFDAIVATFQLA